MSRFLQTTSNANLRLDIEIIISDSYHFFLRSDRRRKTLVDLESLCLQLPEVLKDLDDIVGTLA